MFNQSVKNIMADHLLRGGTIRVFSEAEGCYQDIKDVSFDACGGMILKLEPPKVDKNLKAAKITT